MLGKSAFMLAGYNGELRIVKEDLPSAEAIHPPPVHVRFTFSVCVQDIVRIERAYDYHQSGGRVVSTASDESMLGDEDAVRLLRAVRTGDKETILDSSIVSLARWVLERNGPVFDSPKEKIVLESLDADVSGVTRALPTTTSEFGEIVLRLPADRSDVVSLSPRFSVISYMPFLRNAEIRKEPLPPFAMCLLRNSDYTLYVKGDPSTTEGEFRVGPFTVVDLRSLRLEARYPLWPGVEEGKLVASLYYRNGRPIEQYLDEGRMPPLPTAPHDIPTDGVIPMVVRQMAASVNPDTGEPASAIHMNDDALLVLYAIGYAHLESYGELQAILEDARRRAARRRGAAVLAAPTVLPEREGWVRSDALLVLESRNLADQFALIVQENPEPLDEISLIATKEPPLAPRLAPEYCVPHAVAAASLLLAGHERSSAVIEEQMMRFHQEYRNTDIGRLALEDLILIGQSMKAVAAFGGAAVEKARGVLLEIRAEAHKRFAQQEETLSLKDRIEIAHLASDTWFPYVNAPPFLRFERAAPATPAAPVQSMSLIPAGADREALFLAEERATYKAALARAKREFGASSMTPRQRYDLLESFFEKWHAALWTSHKGGSLQDFEGEYERDMIDSFENAGVLDLYQHP